MKGYFYTKGVPFVNERYTKGVTFLPKIVYKRLRGRNSGLSLPVMRVSIGLTVSHKTAKNLAVRRKYGRILTVSRYKTLTVNRKSQYPIVTLLTVSRKKAKILIVNRRSHYPIETLRHARIKFFLVPPPPPLGTKLT